MTSCGWRSKVAGCCWCVYSLFHQRRGSDIKDDSSDRPQRNVSWQDKGKTAPSLPSALFNTLNIWSSLLTDQSCSVSQIRSWFLRSLKRTKLNTQILRRRKTLASPSSFVNQRRPNCDPNQVRGASWKCFWSQLSVFILHVTFSIPKLSWMFSCVSWKAQCLATWVRAAASVTLNWERLLLLKVFTENIHFHKMEKSKQKFNKHLK